MGNSPLFGSRCDFDSPRSVFFFPKFPFLVRRPFPFRGGGLFFLVFLFFLFFLCCGSFIPNSTWTRAFFFGGNKRPPGDLVKSAPPPPPPTGSPTLQPTFFRLGGGGPTGHVPALHTPPFLGGLFLTQLFFCPRLVVPFISPPSPFLPK